MAQSSRPDHDALHHRLFSHPGVVVQLLRGFVDGPWLAGLDLDGLERLNTKFQAETGQRREGDMVWRIPRRDDEDTYLMSLLEFQSTSDPFMALRVLTYAALLWQHLVSEQRLVAQAKLPPLLPVVVYNGEARRRAPVDLRDLVDLPKDSPLWRWQPDLRYDLVDAGSFNGADLEGREGLPALWFRLESARNPAEVLSVADRVLAWLAHYPGFAASRAVFADLLRALMAPLGPEILAPQDLLEVRDMLATRAEQWKQEWLLEGRQEGHRQGLQEGEAALLMRLLARRFGVLPDWVSARLRSADIALLEEWGIRTLDAGSLDDVFGDRSE